jgi:hypothetical protein
MNTLTWKSSFCCERSASMPRGLFTRWSGSKTRQKSILQPGWVRYRAMSMVSSSPSSFAPSPFLVILGFDDDGFVFEEEVHPGCLPGVRGRVLLGSYVVEEKVQKRVQEILEVVLVPDVVCRSAVNSRSCRMTKEKRSQMQAMDAVGSSLVTGSPLSLSAQGNFWPHLSQNFGTGVVAPLKSAKPSA